MSKFIVRCQRHLQTLSTLHITQQQTCNFHQFHLHDHHLPIPKDDVYIKSKYSPLVNAYDVHKCRQIFQDYKLGEDELISCKIFLNPSIKKTQNSEIEKLAHLRGLTKLATQVESKIKILVVAEREFHKEALNAGATTVITPFDLPDLKNGKLNIDSFDQVVCSPSCITLLNSLGKLLRDKMPHERKGTVTRLMDSAIKDLFCSVEWRSEDCLNHDMTYIIDVVVARGDFTSVMLLNNLMAVFKGVVKYRPSNGVGEFVRRCELHANGEMVYFDYTDLVRKKTVEELEVVMEVKEKEVDFCNRDELKEYREKSKEWSKTVLKDEVEKLSEELRMRWSEVQSS